LNNNNNNNNNNNIVIVIVKGKVQPTDHEGAEG
jgi:hypothetical protein